MRGDLSDTGLEAIFGELSEAESTGALHLEGHAGPAKVFFRDGDVYYASSPAPRAQLGARLVGAGFIDDDELDRALAAQESGPSRTKLGAILVDQGMVRRDVIRVFVQEQILDAVFDLARWDEGALEFFKGDAVAEDLPVQIPIRPLLMEVRRRLSEWADIAAVIPSLDAVPDFVPSGSTTQAALEPDEFTLLTSVDGRRSIRELAHDLGYSQFDAARLIYGLSLLGVIGVPNGQHAADEAPDPEPEVEDEDEGDDEVDVGRALEEALFGTSYEEPGERPEERAEDVGADAEQPQEQPPEQPQEPVGSDDLEPEVWSASIDTDDVAAEPAPPSHPDPAPEPASETPAEPEPEPAQEPEREPTLEREQGPDARDELIALVGELQDRTDEPGPDEARETEDRGTVAPPPPARPEPEPEAQTPPPPQRTERGDVSELLRELSRLAGGGPEPVAPPPDEPEETGDPGGADGPSGPRGRRGGTDDEDGRGRDGGSKGRDAGSKGRDAEGGGKDEGGEGRDAEGGGKDEGGEGRDAGNKGRDAGNKGRDAGNKGRDAGNKGDDKRSTFRKLFGSR